MTQTNNPAARIDDCGHGIFAVDTQYVRPMLDASHVLQSDGEAAFVDTGVNSGVAGLLEALATLKISTADVRWVFLTHIHLDHAGGAGALMQSLPNATAVIHPRGARHMVNPRRLIAGAKAVYGEDPFNAMYGKIQPIDEDRIHVPEDGETIMLGNSPLHVLFTEGHAKHHYCLHHEQANAIFTGDSFGVSYRIFDTVNGAFCFPTTTPVHFDPEAAHQSIDRLIATGAQFALLTHYSRVDDLPRLAAQLHKDIDAFVAIARRLRDHGERARMMRDAMMEYLLSRLDAHGLQIDREHRHLWLTMDVDLNVQGLEHWLDHSDRAASAQQ